MGNPTDDLCQYPSGRQGDGDTGEEGGPVSPVPLLDVIEYKVDVDEVTLQAQCADKHECLVDPFRGAAEYTVE